MWPAPTEAALNELWRRLWPQVCVDPMAREDLATIGVRLPPAIPIRRPRERVTAVLCMPYDLDHPLAFPDNCLGHCSRCQRRIQFRPSIPAGRRVCPFCLLRETRHDA